MCKTPSRYSIDSFSNFVEVLINRILHLNGFFSLNNFLKDEFKLILLELNNDFGHNPLMEQC